MNRRPDEEGIKTLAKRRTVTVVADGRRYVVGPDVELAMGLHDAPILHTQYSETPEYLALVRGALHYMDVSEIDLLVVGLPVRRLGSHARTLTQRLATIHPVGNGRSVLVRKAHVLAQPVGGLISYSTDSGTSGALATTTTLIIDPGFVTVDWVVARGMRPIHELSGHHDGGVSAVLARMAKGLGRDRRIDYTNLAALDAGLRNGAFHLYGKPVDLTPYLQEAAPVMDAAVNALANGAGDARDITSIVLVGGGAHLFLPALQRRYPSHDIHVVGDPVFANVRGFHLAGEFLTSEAAA